MTKTITTLKVADIIPYENNPRHNDNAVEAVAESIKQCEYISPIVVDEDNIILAGHNRAVLYKGDYIVTDDGTVYRFRKNWQKWVRQKPRRHSNGYLRGTINGKDVYLHRLVAECFVDNPHKYKEVNHIDGDKTNNNASNLEWCTRSENNRHAFKAGLRKYEELSLMGKKGGRTRRHFTSEQVREMRSMRERGIKEREVMQKFGVTRGSLWQIVKRVSYADID